MDRQGTWGSALSQMQWRQVDKSVSTAEIGDMIEFVHPWLGVSLWGVYMGKGDVIHFGVGDENMTQKACRSLMQQMLPRSKGDGVLKKTPIRSQTIADIRVPAGTRIRVNNDKHHLAPSMMEQMMHRCQTFLHQEFKYDLINFNSEHFATFIRYGRAVCTQIPFQKMNGEHSNTTETLELIMQQRMETET
ncbi:phospholipase A and acyltransferase 4-like [Hippocampus zosterae]|uniref:phospholipase A and acyltransferase 4-like n=1 Tax=Hippocampus zosterae TaxID=109293 RepID=UPI00223D5253|nr:phospholipase A and acyltransferase 4-like [Hippocampus zosterae]